MGSGTTCIVTSLLVSVIVAGVLFVPGSDAVVYTRWGRKDCESPSVLVYKGYAAGGHYTHTGSGSNFVCLTETPQWGVFDPSNNNLGRIYGTEYGLPATAYLGNSDVPCAVCHISKATEKLMIPGTNICPFGWNVEYDGYLVSGRYSQTAQVDYVCMDWVPDVADFNDPSFNGGAYFHPVEAECGSLPCGPYVQDRELTCVVCIL